MKKIIMLLIMTLTLFGCSNNRNGELAQQLKKDGFFLDAYKKNSDTMLGGYTLTNFTEEDIEKNKSKKGYVEIGVHYLEKYKGLDSIVYYDISINSDEGRDYCVYGGNDKCFDNGYSSEERKTEIASQPKMKKVFNKFLKKYNMTKDEFIDLIEYIYDNDGKLE